MMFLPFFLTHLVFIPAALLCLLPMKNQLRFGLRRTLLAGLPTLAALAAVTAWLETALGLGGNDLLAPVLIICFILYAWNSRAPFCKTLALFSLTLSLLAILSNIALCVDALRGLSDTDEMDQLRAAAFYTGLGSAVVLPLVGLFDKCGSRVVDETIPWPVWAMIILYSLAVFCMNMLFREVLEGVYDDRGMTQRLMAAFCVGLVLWGVLLAVFYETIWHLRTAAEAHERNRLFEMQAYQFNSQQRYIKDSERIRHDFRQSIHTLNGLYEAREYETLGRYLRQYAAELPVKEIAAYTENAALNALLNYYAHISQLNQIRFEARVNLPEALPLNDVDLCGMVGNILENAVIACKRAEERSIRITMLIEDGAQLYIVAVNSFDGYVRMKDGAYLSVSRKGRGIGLASVTAAAEKYGGVAQFHHEGKQFYSNIAIPLSEAGKEEQA